LFSYARLANDTAIILKIPLRKIVILIISEERGLVQRFPSSGEGCILLLDTGRPFVPTSRYSGRHFRQPQRFGEYSTPLISPIDIVLQHSFLKSARITLNAQIWRQGLLYNCN
jgi:hypothetical protein